jgi:hypothetical protein
MLFLFAYTLDRFGDPTDELNVGRSGLPDFVTPPSKFGKVTGLFSFILYIRYWTILIYMKTDVEVFKGPTNY